MYKCDEPWRLKPLSTDRRLERKSQGQKLTSWTCPLPPDEYSSSNTRTHGDSSSSRTNSQRIRASTMPTQPEFDKSSASVRPERHQWPTGLSFLLFDAVFDADCLTQPGYVNLLFLRTSWHHSVYGILSTNNRQNSLHC